jgi:hypothetical protein
MAALSLHPLGCLARAIDPRRTRARPRSCAIYVLHTFTPTAQFYFGTALVLVATKLYTDYPWVTDGRGSSQELSAIVTTDPVSPRKSGPGPDPSRP